MRGNWLAVNGDACMLILCSDPNCGGAFEAAVDDTAFGVVRGCGQVNPRSEVVRPGVGPRCG